MTQPMQALRKALNKIALDTFREGKAPMVESTRAKWPETDDAAQWAAQFRKVCLELGYTDMDEGWLIGWFANAIENAEMVRHPNLKGLPSLTLIQAIRGAVARGWCHDPNRDKEMDSDLALAIADEVHELWGDWKLIEHEDGSKTAYRNMTIHNPPKQAQIEAAAKAAYEANYNDFPWERSLDEDREAYRIMAIAALTAAAGVENEGSFERHSVDFLEGIKEGTTATIESCAQVADVYASKETTPELRAIAYAIASDIRAKKEK